jgi:hypothetical protein
VDAQAFWFEQDPALNHSKIVIPSAKRRWQDGLRLISGQNRPSAQTTSGNNHCQLATELQLQCTTFPGRLERFTEIPSFFENMGRLSRKGVSFNNNCREEPFSSSCSEFAPNREGSQKGPSGFHTGDSRRRRLVEGDWFSENESKISHPASSSGTGRKSVR